MLLGMDWIKNWKTVANHNTLLFPGIQKHIWHDIILRIDILVSKFCRSSSEVHVENHRGTKEKIWWYKFI